MNLISPLPSWRLGYINRFMYSICDQVQGFIELATKADTKLCLRIFLKLDSERLGGGLSYTQTLITHPWKGYPCWRKLKVAFNWHSTDMISILRNFQAHIIRKYVKRHLSHYHYFLTASSWSHTLQDHVLAYTSQEQYNDPLFSWWCWQDLLQELGK